MSWFDKLPAPVRDGVLTFVGGFASMIVAAIAASNGVTGVDWAETLKGALDTGTLAAASVLAITYITPLTKKYGVRKQQ